MYELKNFFRFVFTNVWLVFFALVRLWSIEFRKKRAWIAHKATPATLEIFQWKKYSFFFCHLFIFIHVADTGKRNGVWINQSILDRAHNFSGAIHYAGAHFVIMQKKICRINSFPIWHSRTTPFIYYQGGPLHYWVSIKEYKIVLQIHKYHAEHGKSLNICIQFRGRALYGLFWKRRPWYWITGRSASVAKCCF